MLTSWRRKIYPKINAHTIFYALVYVVMIQCWLVTFFFWPILPFSLIMINTTLFFRIRTQIHRMFYVWSIYDYLAKLEIDLFTKIYAINVLHTRQWMFNDWEIEIHLQFPHSSMIAKNQNKHNIHITEEMWGYENYCRKCITLGVMNGGTVRELAVNSRFPEELS
jgi:hypothetical protein